MENERLAFSNRFSYPLFSKGNSLRVRISDIRTELQDNTIFLDLCRIKHSRKPAATEVIYFVQRVTAMPLEIN